MLVATTLGPPDALHVFPIESALPFNSSAIIISQWARWMKFSLDSLCIWHFCVLRSHFIFSRSEIRTRVWRSFCVSLQTGSLFGGAVPRKIIDKKPLTAVSKRMLMKQVNRLFGDLCSHLSAHKEHDQAHTCAPKIWRLLWLRIQNKYDFRKMCRFDGNLNSICYFIQCNLSINRFYVHFF